eukprot:gene425-2430_t
MRDVVHLAQSAFMVGFTTLLVVFVDWAELISCGRHGYATECENAAVIRVPSFLNAVPVLILLFEAVFSLYVLYQALYCAKRSVDMWGIRCFCLSCGLTDQQLPNQQIAIDQSFSVPQSTVVQVALVISAVLPTQ